MAFQMLIEGVVHTTSIVANFFEKCNWLGRFSRIDDWNDTLTVAEDFLEFLVVACKLSDFFVLSFREADLETL